MSSWTTYKLTPKNSRLAETLKFLLDHPRRCFVYMFPSTQTWFLAFLMFSLTSVQPLYPLAFPYDHELTTYLVCWIGYASLYSISVHRESSFPTPLTFADRVQRYRENPSRDTYSSCFCPIRSCPCGRIRNSPPRLARTGREGPICRHDGLSYPSSRLRVDRADKGSIYPYTPLRSLSGLPTSMRNDHWGYSMKLI